MYTFHSHHSRLHVTQSHHSSYTITPFPLHHSTIHLTPLHHTPYTITPYTFFWEVYTIQGLYKLCLHWENHQNELLFYFIHDVTHPVCFVTAVPYCWNCTIDVHYMVCYYHTTSLSSGYRRIFEGRSHIVT